MTKPGRIPCCVPFCRRTSKDDGIDGQEVICGKHYRAANKTLRRRYAKLRRRVEAAMDRSPESCSAQERTNTIQAYCRLEVMWGEIKRQAIEAAVGIA